MKDFMEAHIKENQIPFDNHPLILVLKLKKFTNFSGKDENYETGYQQAISDCIDKTKEFLEMFAKLEGNK